MGVFLSTSRPGTTPSLELKTFVNTLPLDFPFDPIKPAYWTGYPHHRRTPFAVAPNGDAYLAYLDNSYNTVHVQSLNVWTLKSTGQTITFTGNEAGGLVAHNDGFAILTNEAVPGSGAPNNMAIAAIRRYGAQTWTTSIGGAALPTASGWLDGLLASPDLNGDLVYSEESGLYGAYYVTTVYGGKNPGHFGDTISYVNETGGLERINGASSDWGCSHNTGIAFEAADKPPFASICAEDQGAIWLNTKNTGMNKAGVKISNEHVINGGSGEPMGGMSGSYSSLARMGNGYAFAWVSRGASNLTPNTWMGDGYTKAANRTYGRRVAIATFSDKYTLNGPQASSVLGAQGDSQIKWLSSGGDASNAHVAAFDSEYALVTWEQIDNPNCFDAMGCSGQFAGTYFQLVKNGEPVGEPTVRKDVYVAGDMVTVAGAICWPYVSMDWKLDGPTTAAPVDSMSIACMNLLK